MIDEGTLLVLQSANGAFSCRYPPLPRKWNSVDRPHIANLVSLDRQVFRVYLSTPSRVKGSMEYDLMISDLDRLPTKSIIEIRHDNIEFSYYRKDEGIWTKVAESSSPFMVEVFSHGTTLIIVDIAAR